MLTDFMLFQVKFLAVNLAQNEAFCIEGKHVFLQNL